MNRNKRKSRPQKRPVQPRNIDGVRAPQPPASSGSRWASRRKALRLALARAGNFLKERISRKKITASSIAVGLVIAGVVIYANGNFHLLDNKNTTSNQTGTSGIERNPPGADFSAITPTEASQLQWARISPPENDPVYAFIDTIGTTQIQVSQQPLPRSIADDVSTGVKQIAEDFGAKRLLDAESAQVYIGVSSTGTQSVIFAKQDVLVLIRSNDRIADQAWIDYINQLQ